MNSKIKSGLLGLAAAALLVANAATAAPPVVQAGDWIKFADGNGAHPGGAFVITDYNAGGTIVKGSFESFCVEYNEHMSYGPFYKVDSISNEARNGGVGGGSPDPLDFRTAWLYTQYVENQSALNVVAGWGTANAVDRGTAMQNAVWYLENEIGSVTGLASNLVAAAGAAGWQDTGRVHILNVQTLAGGVAQDQLYIAPVPEPEIYAMLGLGLGMMGWVGRRQRKLRERANA